MHRHRTLASILLALLCASSGHAEQDLQSDRIHLYYADNGVNYNREEGAGILVDYAGDGTWYEWTDAGGSINPLLGDSFRYTRGATTYEYEQIYGDDGYVTDAAWTTEGEDDLSSGDDLIARYTWDVNHLRVVKTDTWSSGGLWIFVKLEVTNSGSSGRIRDLTYAHVVDPVDSNEETRSSNTRNDLDDLDGDGIAEWAQAQGRRTLAGTNNNVMAFASCDPSGQQVGFSAGTDISISDLSLEDDPEKASANYQLVFLHEEEEIAPLDTAIFGFMVVFGESTADAQTTFLDNVSLCYDLDGDGFENALGAGDDCDDEDASVHPDAEETWYDGVDQDCGGDDDYDQDGDGYVPDEYEGLATTDPSTGEEIEGTGEAPGGDCDDTDGTVNPAAEETWYNGLDEDCQRDSDYDQDGDGYTPDEYEGLETTDPGTGEVVDDGTSTDPGDCDDTDASINPAAEETWYNGIDEDCQGDTDFDQDGDGYTPEEYAGEPTYDPGTGDVVDDGTSTEVGDCDDTDPEINAGTPDEWYDGIDSNCQGDDDYDQDADGWVPEEYEGLPTYDTDGNVIEGTGEAPGGDCDDEDPDVNPGAEEDWYNGIDEDCGGDSDYDQDGDGYAHEDYEGLPTFDTQGDEIEGTADLPGGDCDDTDEDVYPGADDDPYDGDDDACDGEYDADGDGYPSDGYDTDGDGDIDDDDGGDCDDTDEDVNPDASDDWYDGEDTDCAGNDDYDADGDGFVPDEFEGLVTREPDGDVVEDTGDSPAGDCDDDDASVHPGADEIWYDGIDGDCAGDDDYDADGDGHTPEEYGDLPTYTNGGEDLVPGTGDLPNDDCDDTDPTIIACDEFFFHKGGGGCSCASGVPSRTAGWIGAALAAVVVRRRRR